MKDLRTGSDFKAAEAHIGHYNALYVINESDDKKIRSVLGNIRNVLKDYRLKGKIHVEIVAFGDGVALYEKKNKYDDLLAELREQGVWCIQCANTMIGRKIDKDELYDYVQYVPSGNGEIILRQYEGWAVVHP